MEVSSVWRVIVYIVGVMWVMKMVLKKVNAWKYEMKLGEKRHKLPPGDMGLPYIGNMRAFLKAFKSPYPDSFMNAFHARFGRTGIYKGLMFGNPSIFVTTPELCRKVLTDDDNFKFGWPAATHKLIGRNSFVDKTGDDEFKRLKKVTSSTINGHETLSSHIEHVEDTVKRELEKWTKMGEIEVLKQLRRCFFLIIMKIFISSENELIMEALERDFEMLSDGIRAMAINLPGFVYHKGLKARKRVLGVLQTVIDERRAEKRESVAIKAKSDLLDTLIDSGFQNEEIIDLLIMYLIAGHSTSAHIMMWVLILLEQHPHVLQKAKAEQEEIVKNMLPGQKGLTLNEIRNMKYLSQVLNETLRWVTLSYITFREATKETTLNGYVIPKGWRVMVWFRCLHLDPEIWPEPMTFDPSRWDDLTPKAGTFLPFGLGSRLCPGKDMAKLEISIFLHHFLLNYRMDRTNPDAETKYLPYKSPADHCVAKIRKT